VKAWDGAAGGMEDQVDENVAVPRLHEPALRWALEAKARRRERLLRPFDVALAHEEVDVVVGRRAAARPRGEPAPEEERHLRVAQRGRAALHRLDELEEGVVGLGAHGPWVPIRRVTRTRSGY